MIKFRDIPQFTQRASYKVDVPWSYLEGHLARFGEGIKGGANIDPDFQRAHVWSKNQQIKYVEFILKGGLTGKNVYWNCPNWQGSGTLEKWGPLELVDGKQQLTAVLRFLRNEIPIFGSNFYKDYTDKLDICTANFAFWVNDLKTRREVLQWYLDLNDGGVVHTSKELMRVRKLLEQEK